MSSHCHAIVWIDDREARIFHLNASDVERLVVHGRGANRCRHNQANGAGSSHAGIDGEFFGRVTAGLAGLGAFLITGPAAAKVELKNFIAAHAPALAQRISAVETLDHPSNDDLVALARKFFSADDRLHAQRP